MRNVRFVKIVSMPSTIAWYNRPDVFGHTFEVLDISPFDYVKIEYEPGVTGWLSLENCIINPHLQLVPQKENPTMLILPLQDVPTTLEQRVYMSTTIKILDNTLTAQDLREKYHAECGSLLFMRRDGKDFLFDFQEYSGNVEEKDGERFISFWSKDPDWELAREPEYEIPGTWDVLSKEYDLIDTNHNIFLSSNEDVLVPFEITEITLMTYDDQKRDYSTLYIAKQQDLDELNKVYCQT